MGLKTCYVKGRCETNAFFLFFVQGVHTKKRLLTLLFAQLLYFYYSSSNWYCKMFYFTGMHAFPWSLVLCQYCRFLVRHFQFNCIPSHTIRASTSNPF